MNLPETAEGAACLSAVESSIVGGGMAGVWVDAPAALALAGASGVSAHVAAPLVTAAALGVRLGIADSQKRDEA